MWNFLEYLPFNRLILIQGDIKKCNKNKVLTKIFQIKFYFWSAYILNSTPTKWGVGRDFFCILCKIVLFYLLALVTDYSTEAWWSVYLFLLLVLQTLLHVWLFSKC